ncbi:hypothetical protein C5167_038714 [Papaver somniferum]|uniref:SNRNP25 ubiquitin-like domain-containing protein n=1 Tax=Papaver somniferum TaxID=3469 RepID=A0A4Y7IA13_PAPSO|nr:hypothetical protein C5167_038714 [Papaver somniferum]
MGHHHISWRHVWGNFCLLYHNEKLIHDKSMLQDFGMRIHSTWLLLVAVSHYLWHVVKGIMLFDLVTI